MDRDTKLTVGQLLEVSEKKNTPPALGFSGRGPYADDRELVKHVLLTKSRVVYLGEDHEFEYTRKHHLHHHVRYAQIRVRQIRVLTIHGPLWVNIERLRHVRMAKKNDTVRTD